MKICHVGTMPLEQMGDITRYIYSDCIGEHVYCLMGDELPDADIYLLHCFKNRYEEFADFEPPKKAKVISLIHSTYPCDAAFCSDAVVNLTDAAETSWLARTETENLKSVIISGFTDVKKYAAAKIDYNIPHFGRASRLERGKFHYYWGELINELFAKIEVVKNYLVCQTDENAAHDRIEVIRNVKIDDIDAKINAMEQYSIYADAHNDMHPFIETFCMAMVEAMAAGQAVIILGCYQESMKEVLGDAGIVCNNIFEYYDRLTALANNAELREYYGMKAKERAKLYDKELHIPKWNKLFGDVLND